MGSMYIPERGDVVWVNLRPRSGHEQSGRRPGIVISPGSYNRKVGLMLCCPITSKEKGYPFEVRLPQGLPVSGVVLADQVRSLDWKKRKVSLIGKVLERTTEELLGKLRTLL